MKVLGIIGSPRHNGNTHILVNKILEGSASSGHTVKEIFLAKYKINECNGCHACWRGKECPEMDDMNNFFPLISESDVLIFGTPVYWYGPTALIKAFLDRFVYFNSPENRNKIEGKKAIIVSPYEEEGFEAAKPLIEMFEKSFDYLKIELIGKILAPGVDKKGDVTKFQDIINQAINLGKSIH